MAGSYPDVPSRRMAWDEDGSILLSSSFTGTGRSVTAGDPPNNPWTEQPVNVRVEANDEDIQVTAISSGSNQNPPSLWICLIFPELREIDGFYDDMHVAAGLNYYWQRCSGDTTNGIDGSWSTEIVTGKTLPSAQSGSNPTHYRTAISSTAVSNIRALRTFTSRNAGSNTSAILTTFHVYGEITPGQTPDRLLFIDTGTSLEFGLPIDYGDIPRGSASDRTFKLRNNSGTLTATTIQVTAEALYGASGSWYTFSDGGAFQSTLPLTAGSIGPGADSATITARRITPDAAVLGLHAARIQASVGSW